MYDEHSTYSSKDFLLKLIDAFPFPIREIQTDNGSEWTNALLVKDPSHDKTSFEKQLDQWEILYHRIRIASNGRKEILPAHADVQSGRWPEADEGL